MAVLRLIDCQCMSFAYLVLPWCCENQEAGKLATEPVKCMIAEYVDKISSFCVINPKKAQGNFTSITLQTEELYKHVDSAHGLVHQHKC